MQHEQVSPPAFDNAACAGCGNINRLVAGPALAKNRAVELRSASTEAKQDRGGVQLLHQADRAVTLVETLVCLGILAALAGLTYALSSPARESARQAACSANLRQMHLAVMQYTIDWHSVEDVPGLGPLACGAVQTKALQPYLKNADVRFCPSLPVAVKQRISHTRSYIWEPVADWMVLDPSSGEKQMLEHQHRRIQELGTEFPLSRCTIHDEMFYQPREAHIDSKLTQPFIVEVSVGGSIYKGRRPYPRENMIAAWTTMP
jgi:type II secretory pathway pseudopilin PulG